MSGTISMNDGSYGLNRSLTRSMNISLNSINCCPGSSLAPHANVWHCFRTVGPLHCSADCGSILTFTALALAMHTVFIKSKATSNSLVPRIHISRHGTQCIPCRIYGNKLHQVGCPRRHCEEIVRKRSPWGPSDVTLATWASPSSNRFIAISIQCACAALPCIFRAPEN